MKKLTKHIFAVIIVVVAVVLSICSFSYAKYVSDSVWNYYIESQGFYFSSDYLGTTSVANVNNIWDGSSVHFNVKNAINDGVTTIADINYTVTCTLNNSDTCKLNGTDSNTYTGVLSSYEACTNNSTDGVDVSTYDKSTCEMNSYNWSKQVASKDLYFDIANSDNVIATITVQSTSPYSKTLTGTFELNKVTESESVSLKYTNKTNYSRLVISNSFTTAKCVQITWNADNIRVDNTATVTSTDTSGYINGVKLSIPAKGTESLIFHSRDLTKTYDETAFTLTDTDGC